jgi:hypothetical protein
LADPKQDESFKVVDRRLFTAEGELRPEAVEEQRREQEKSAQPQKGAKTEKAAPSAPAAQPSPVLAQPAPAPAKNFHLLVDMLARNAAALMGGIPDPGTGQTYLDLEGAREMIDMLDTLREKTRGNLAAEEDGLLSDVLGSLKLSFMEISKAAAKAMREGPKAKR